MTANEARRAVATRAAFRDAQNRIYVASANVDDEETPTKGSNIESIIMTVVLERPSTTRSVESEFPTLNEVVQLRDYHGISNAGGNFLVVETFLRSRAQRLKHRTLGVRLERA